MPDPRRVEVRGDDDDLATRCGPVGFPRMEAQRVGPKAAACEAVLPMGWRGAAAVLSDRVRVAQGPQVEEPPMSGRLRLSRDGE